MILHTLVDQNLAPYPFGHTDFLFFLCWPPIRAAVTLFFPTDLDSTTNGGRQKRPSPTGGYLIRDGKHPRLLENGTLKIFQRGVPDTRFLIVIHRTRMKGNGGYVFNHVVQFPLFEPGV